MFTDPKRIKFTDPGHPQDCNVHRYYAVFAPERKAEVDELCRKARIGCTDCKKELAEILVKVLAPIQEKRNELLKDKKRLEGILEEGRARAQAAAAKTLAEVKEIMRL
jgi:tryptophanyl-tRNA synthetase